MATKLIMNLRDINVTRWVSELTSREAEIVKQAQTKESINEIKVSTLSDNDKSLTPAGVRVVISRIIKKCNTRNKKRAH